MSRLAVCIWALCLGPVWCQAQTIQAVTETTPYTYVEGTKVAGTATEVVELTLQRAGLTDYTLRLYPWARAYDMALKEPGVLIFLIARTAAREDQFRWVGEIMKIQYHLYRLKSRPLDINTLESAKAYTIGVMRDDVRQQYLRSKGLQAAGGFGPVAGCFQETVERSGGSGAPDYRRRGVAVPADPV